MNLQPMLEIKDQTDTVVALAFSHNLSSKNKRRVTKLYKNKIVIFTDYQSAMQQQAHLNFNKQKSLN